MLLRRAHGPDRGLACTEGRFGQEVWEHPDGYPASVLPLIGFYSCIDIQKKPYAPQQHALDCWELTNGRGTAPLNPNYRRATMGAGPTVSVL